MANSPSAGVYVTEEDRSQFSDTIQTSVAVMVGEAKKGPVGKAVWVSSFKEFTQKFGLPDASLGFLHHSVKAFFTKGEAMYVTRCAPGALYGGLTVGWNLTVNAITAWPLGLADPAAAAFTATDMFSVYAENQGAWSSGLSIKVYPNTIQNNGMFFVDVYVGSSGVPAESHNVTLAMLVDGYGTQRNLEYYINHNSSLIRVKQNPAQPAGSSINTVLAKTAMVGGTNGTRATAADFIAAFELYSDPEMYTVNMLVSAGLTDPTIAQAMDEICQARRDCTAILDAPRDSQSVSNLVTWRQTTLAIDSAFSALYAPDVLVYDAFSDIHLLVPVSGYIAAAYAATDKDYAQWWAPAGMDRGDLDVEGVRVTYNQADRDLLVQNQINPMRVFARGGVKIWGADTLQIDPSALSNVNVRRLINLIETSLAKAALYSVFNPNDPILWTQLYDICDRRLSPIKDARGLYDYGIVCDTSNNSKASIQAGDVHLDIYADPALPAKRIHLNAIVNKTGAVVTAAYSNR